MAALDETLGRAIRAKSAELRDQRMRVVWIGVAGASYALDAVVLALFAAAGTVAFTLCLGYALGALLISGAFYAAVASGWSQRFADPGLVAWQVPGALAMQLAARLAESRRRLAESMAQIQELVSHDELTKTLNRRALMARLEQERARAERTGQGFSVALLDLDRFKLVNDTHGHAAGDAVLVQFARTVHDTMRETDVFGRYGGEEFMMILTTTALEPAQDALERIRAAVHAHDWSAIAPGLAVTVSAGVTGWRRGENTTQTLQRADGALYEAKHAGRNQVCAA